MTKFPSVQPIARTLFMVLVFPQNGKDLTSTSSSRVQANQLFCIEGPTVYPFKDGDWGNILTDMANSNRWILGENEDPNAEYPRLSYGGNSNNYRPSTYWLRNGSYLRLKNLEIGYNIPKSLINKIHLNNVRLYFMGTNLITFSNFKLWDPELGSTNGQAYPLSRSYTLGLTINI